MRQWATSYRVGERTYAGFILAGSMEDARAIAGRRGMGEVVDGELAGGVPLRRFSEVGDAELLGSLPAVLHQSSWLAWAAVSSGDMTVGEVLGDEGVIHELIHLLHLGPEPAFLGRCREGLARLESLPLGFFPPRNQSPPPA